jgi:F-type H+-transporting ATPase subunit a|tara:strand:+ start:511 stop:1287 length:777 start_codon:yes stop_codon:yes gene_type:complete
VSAADQESGGLGIDPMHQFEVTPIIPIHFGGIDASFTNASMWMVFAAIGIISLTVFAMSGRAMVPGRWQSIAELSYEFVANMVRDNVGKAGQSYFPFIFTLFMFVLFSNMLGMLPYSFTTTSHIIVTFALALFIFIGVTLIGVVKHGFHFLSLFVPKGLPAVLLPLIVVIEVISYLSRPISLSVRLFANMMAGHTMLKVFAGFVIGFLGAGGLFTGLAIAPIAFMVAFTGLEILVAFLQAYVFAILTCIYLNDALHLH